MTELTGLEIAVVGLAGRFPGASTVDEFWRMVLAGSPAVRRFSTEDLDGARVGERQRAHSHHVPVGGVLDDIEYFDAGFFGYSPRDAAVLDPQHRLFLECAWHALEHAGHCVNRVGVNRVGVNRVGVNRVGVNRVGVNRVGVNRNDVVGVYASASMNTYLLRHLLGNPEVPGGLSPMDLILANDKDTLASRVAYHLDLTGPAITVQTACSSSLVAVHLACQALLSGDCDIALAGGVSVRPPQHEGYRYQEGGILSPDGRCLPFDADARGAVAGNGVAAVVLRPLADALRDGDTIHAVVKGTAVNNDGAGKVGFTAPSVTGQTQVIRAAHEVSAVEPATIGYVEAHGTATALGDPIEVAALTSAFGDRTGACALGSVKALVGHLDAAAGITGFVKAVLAVKHGVLPPSPYFREPNPETGLDAGPFFVNREPLPWAGLRRAGVSSFAMGGTNAHAVLEQAPAVEASGPARPRQLLVLAAATAEALAQSRRRLRESLAEPDCPPLADIAHTLRVGRRTTLPHRLALVCGDSAEAATLLADGANGPVWMQEPSEHRRPLVFLFPGQGSQYVGMAGQLYGAEPVFRAALDECAELLVPHLGTDLRRLIQAGGDAVTLGRTRFTQPALFAVEYALATLWMHWGVRPAALLGHSIGEYVAACLAGVLTLPDALALVAARGELMDRLPGGAMLAVPLAVRELMPLLDSEPDSGVCLAASNAPGMCTVAGPVDAIDRFTARLAGRGVTARRLRTSHAFHSAMIDPMLPAFAERVSRVELRAPELPVVSNISGDWMTAEQATDPGYWTQHARQPVRFSEGLQTVLAQGPAILLEVGPGPTLSTLARQHGLADGGHVAFASLRHPSQDQHDLDTMLSALGRLWLAGAEVDLGRLTADERRSRVPLPQYPFQRRRHWVELPGTMPSAVAPEPVELPAQRADHRTEPAGDLLAITRIWQDLLGIARIDPYEDFFELGGHSLLATQILARIADTLGVALPAGAIFQAPTPARLAELVAQVRIEQDEPPAEDAEPPAGGADGADLARLLAEIRRMSPEQLRAELDRERDAEEIPQP